MRITRRQKQIGKYSFVLGQMLGNFVYWCGGGNYDRNGDLALMVFVTTLLTIMFAAWAIETFGKE